MSMTWCETVVPPVCYKWRIYNYVLRTASLTHLPLDKMAAISQTTFSNAISSMTNLYCDSNFTEVCSWESSWQKVSIGPGNGLTLNRRQAITLTKVDPIHRCIYPVPGEMSWSQILLSWYLYMHGTGNEDLTEKDTETSKIPYCPYQLIEAEWCIYASPTQAIIGSDNGCRLFNGKPLSELVLYWTIRNKYQSNYTWN